MNRSVSRGEARAQTKRNHNVLSLPAALRGLFDALVSRQPIRRLRASIESQAQCHPDRDTIGM